MNVDCPHCRANIHLNADGSCPVCGQQVARVASRPVHDDVHDVPITASFRPTPNPASSRPIGDIQVVGRRRNLIGILATGLVCAVLGLDMAFSGFNPILVGLIVLLGMSLLTHIRLFLWPPRLAIRDGWLEVRGLGGFRVPIEELRDVRLIQRHPLVILHDCGSVEPATMRQQLSETAARQGFHFSLPAESLKLEQVNAFRQALHLPPCDDEATDPISRFEKLLHGVTPYVFVTPALVAVNAVIFALMIAANRQTGDPLTETLLAWGANSAPLTLQGQPWRLLTCMFLHFSIMHVAINMWVLWDIGKLVERLLGNGTYLVMYLTAGFFGSVASVLWHENTISAGASGAVFGVFGALLGFLLPARGSIPIEVIKQHRTNVIVFFLFNLVIGLNIEWIDMSAHAGGFVTGLVFGLLASHELSPESLGARRVRCVSVSALAILACAVTVFLLPTTPDSAGVYITATERADRWSEQRLGQVTAKQQAGLLSSDEAAKELREKVLPHYEQLAKELHESESESEEIKYLLEYIALREEAFRLVAEGIENKDIVRQGQALEKLDEASAAFPPGSKLARLLSTPPPSTYFNEAARFSVVEAAVTSRLQETLTAMNRGDVTREEAASVIETNVLAPWNERLARIEKVRLPMVEDNRTATENLVEYMHLRRDSWQLLVESLRDNDPEKLRQYEQKRDAADTLGKRG